MELHDQLAAGVAALKGGKTAQAADLLLGVVSDPAFKAQLDLSDLRARACSLCAQALLAEGRLREADLQVRTALGLLRHLGDQDGQREVRTLQEQIDTALAAAQPAKTDPAAVWVASTPIERLLEGVVQPERRADLLLKKANAFLDSADPTSATPLAEQALREDPSVRTQVFARLTLARALPHQAATWIEEALAEADQHDEFTLVGAVARAAALQGVDLPTVSGVSR